LISVDSKYLKWSIHFIKKKKEISKFFLLELLSIYIVLKDEEMYLKHLKEKCASVNDRNKYQLLNYEKC
jgi:hypothetical protein